MVTLVPSSTRTRMLLTHGPDELLRAVLPPPTWIYRERAVPMLLEALAQWVDSRIRVVLSVDVRDASSFCLGLTDEMGCGARGLFYEVEVVERGARRRRGARIRGIGDFSDLRQLRLAVPPTTGSR
jgi:class 3 adenylate cyclase